MGVEVPSGNTKMLISKGMEIYETRQRLLEACEPRHNIDGQYMSIADELYLYKHSGKGGEERGASKNGH